MNRLVAILTASALALLGLAATLSWNGTLPGGRSLRSIAWSPERLATWDRAQHARARLDAFAANPVPAGAVVFLGSTDVEEFPLETAFPGVAAVNRGVVGDRIGDVIARLDASLAGAPAAGVVVVTGVEDLRDGRQVGDVRDDLGRLIDALLARDADTPIAIVGPLGAAHDLEPLMLHVRTYDIAAKRLAVLRGAAYVSLLRGELADRSGRVLSTREAHGSFTPEAYDEIARAILRDGGAVGGLLATRP